MRHMEGSVTRTATGGYNACKKQYRGIKSIYCLLSERSVTDGNRERH